MTRSIRQVGDPVLRERIVFTLGLFCGHMKSARFVESFAWQMGVAVERLAAARKRAESLQQEIVLLKRELVQQQARRLRVAAQRPAATETSTARVQRGAPASEDRAEDASGFAHTQPYEREPS